MSEEKKKTSFTVDENLCVGCGVCVDACPMKILAVRDGLCVMTDITRCLECGTCMRECPVQAIAIAGVREKAKDKAAAKPAAGGGTAPPREKLKFMPILKTLQGLLEETVKPVQVFEFDGVDIRSLNDFELEGEKCFYRAYMADKVEKIGVSSMNFYGSMTADVIIITPGPAYDMPYYVIDWDESEDHIFFICDLMPGDDPGRNQRYLTEYLYDPLEELYMNYCMIPGLKSSVFHWVRAIHSPYIITGTIEKSSRENVDLLFNCAVDYLKVWLELWKKAKPQDPSSAYMRLVHERRKNIRALYKENDPGVGSLNKFLGDKMAGISLAIIEP
jgi:NAD-dependent dihydropyrimidine dehydrogenase PreA subunit